MDRRPDRYLLCLWPEGTAGGVTRTDAVLRQTSEGAAYWHTWARALPPPPNR
ncbi:hypothetical protein ACWDXH_19315 [Micromonospora chokoriensis]